MNLVHLLASPFVGGPERQVLGLARHLRPDYRTMFVTFAEGGRCQPFLEEARGDGFEAHALEHNMPSVRRAVQEVVAALRRHGARVLLTSGYKPDIIGWLAGRQARVPVIAIAHGWTGAAWKVRLNEAFDRFVMRFMYRVVCVSQAQAERVRHARVPDHKIAVIRNAVDDEAFAPPDPAYRDKLLAFFPRPPARIVGSAGRLSPEKGFGLLVDAARLLAQEMPDLGFIHFGAGPLRDSVHEAIDQAQLGDRFVLAGFQGDVAKYLPHLDLCALPSFTEGLPVILLEAFAAGVPVVATAVGGTPEVVQDGVNGLLIPPGDPAALAAAIGKALSDHDAARRMGESGRERVRLEFTFRGQSEAWRRLLAGLSTG